ncbi:NAD(P)/FAD-dependent oxidoreductase [Paraflavisolibacter sp. H34]|uniref:NAD(P)/FAD-dependent oxidoreductase n=1 Tax=Huijunlia imazamoxiresistens TaxID=3127457 RepID=UPI0030190F02
MSRKRLIVVGGGAAGFFCAVNAARLDRNLKVTIVEKTGKLLSKVKVSGGGRCNVTHALFDPVEMSRRYPRGTNFVKKAFHQFFTTDTIEWFEARGVKLKTESDGRMFPVTDSSQSVIDCLMAEANRYGVEILMHAEVKEVQGQNGSFSLQLAGGRTLSAEAVCIACGGYPKAALFEWLRQLGHSIAEPVPSLFTFNLPQHPITKLMGVSAADVRIKIEGTRLAEQGPVLVTHWGLSGPAVLRLSAWGARELFQKEYTFTVHLNWMPEENEQGVRAQLQEFRSSVAAKKVVSHNFTSLPNRLWQFLLEQSGIGEAVRWADLPAKAANALVKNLVDYTVEVKGKTTFKEEFVTAGGIVLGEIDVHTMMSKKVPGLYFAGEIADVDGITGGFNFQNAWTTGWIAANSIAAGQGQG